MPVAEGSLAPLNGIEKAQIADFVHGADGFGNTDQPAAKVPPPVTANLRQTEALLLTDSQQCQSPQTEKLSPLR